MIYTVDDRSPRVQRTLESASDAQRVQFDRIKRILADDPYPSDDFPLISEHVSGAGRTFYQYFDEVFPWIVQFRVFEPDNEWQSGWVWISNLVRPNSRVFT